MGDEKVQFAVNDEKAADQHWSSTESASHFSLGGKFIDKKAADHWKLTIEHQSWCPKFKILKMASFAKKIILNPLVFCPFTRGFFSVKSNLKNCHFKTAIVELWRRWLRNARLGGLVWDRR